MSDDEGPRNEDPVEESPNTGRSPRDLWIRLTWRDYATLKAAADIAETAVEGYAAEIIEARARALRSEPDSPVPN